VRFSILASGPVWSPLVGTAGAEPSLALTLASRLFHLLKPPSGGGSILWSQGYVGGILAFHLAPGAIAAPSVKGDVAGWRRNQRRFQQAPRTSFVPVEDGHGWRNHDH
jgi:hypothetical protein